MKTLSLSLLLTLAAAVPCFAKVVEYDLAVESLVAAPAGKTVRALTINGGIPGPVLRFTEGDVARIRVHNRLASGETSMHWHGLLVPNSEDGVPLLTTPVIHAGESRTFQFPLRHAGTYWYHSHSGLQEQQGVYGSIVVTPRGGEKTRADRDHVLLLSDWTNESPGQVMQTLMRGSDWYSIRKGTTQSLLCAVQHGALKQYLKREWSRLPAMDVSDVAYDAFLMNGARSVHLDGWPGETLRLRVINGGASSYFYVESSTGPLTIIANDGMDVRPIRQKRLLIGNGETYDLLVRIPASGQWELRASANDGSGFASAYFGKGEPHPAPTLAAPDSYNMSVSLAAVLDQLDESGVLSDTQALAQEKERPLPPYRRLRAVKSTTIAGGRTPRTIPLHLTGDMMRYIWSINGKTITEETTIPVKRGEVLRFELINDTMMSHPMHLHGHFFRLLMDPKKPLPDAPLKHTVDVPPMSQRTIEFLANEEKDWIFHCHNLYHMHGGMGRILSYDDQGPGHRPQLDMNDHAPTMWMLDASLQTHMSMGSLMLQNTRNNFGIMWDTGWGHDPLGPAVRHDGGPLHRHKMPAVEYEIDAMWQRYISPRWSTMLGYRVTNMMGENDRAFAGAMYMLPGMFMATGTVDSEGEFRFGIAKNIQLTSRLGAFGRVEYDTDSDWMWSTGATYTLTKNTSLITQYDSDHGFGGGFQIRF